MRRKRTLFLLMVILVLVAGAASLIGAVSLFPWKHESLKILWEIRVPRIIMAALVGMMLATAGVIFQAILRNPLADPYILGVSSGAGVGAALSIVLGIESLAWGLGMIPAMAFIGALLATFSVYKLANIGGKTRPETLILSGVAVGFIASALLSLIIVLNEELQAIYFWLLGSLSGASWEHLGWLLGYAFIGMAITFFYARELNVLLLGEEVAATLGIEVERVRLILLAAGSLLAAGAVAFCGLIGFVGLLVPHMVRLVVGANHRWLIPISAIVGALVMILADTVARTILAPTEIPIGVVMALVGSPFFIYLLRSKKSA